MSRRLKLTIAYDGTGFHGWQAQPELPTIQGTLEAALERIEGKRVEVAGSGRTDAGVHALAQVAACTLDNPIPAANLRLALNRLLPCEIRVTAVEDAAASFHPRFDAVAKTYEYRILRPEICLPFDRRYVYHFPYPLDEDRFVEAAGVYSGEHDFSAFAAADPKDHAGGSKVRTIFSAAAWRANGLLLFRVRGSGFLKHMVRNFVGGLLEVGKGNLAAEDLRALLKPGAGRKLGRGAPARGLFLISVEYPDA